MFDGGKLRRFQIYRHYLAVHFRFNQCPLSKADIGKKTVLTGDVILQLVDQDFFLLNHQYCHGA
jgi:hypothetical protein